MGCWYVEQFSFVCGCVDCSAVDVDELFSDITCFENILALQVRCKEFEDCRLHFAPFLCHNLSVFIPPAFMVVAEWIWRVPFSEELQQQTISRRSLEQKIGALFPGEGRNHNGQHKRFLVVQTDHRVMFIGREQIKWSVVWKRPCDQRKLLFFWVLFLVCLFQNKTDPDRDRHPRRQQTWNHAKMYRWATNHAFLSSYNRVNSLLLDLRTEMCRHFNTLLKLTDWESCCWLLGKCCVVRLLWQRLKWET